MPGRPRIHYNRALVLQALERHDEAETVLLDALELDETNAPILEALALFYAQRGRWADARRYAQRLVVLAPNAPGPRRLLEQLEAAAQR